MRVEGMTPVKEMVRGRCRYEFSATVYCGKKPRTSFEIILDAIRKAAGLTVILAAAVLLIVPEAVNGVTLADDPDLARQLAAVINGLRRAIEVGVE
jgi:hypothetical protein